MRICHLTTVHDWSDTRIFVKMCQSASSDGFQVDLIAPVAREHPVTDSKGVTVHAMRKYRSRVLRASLGTLRAIRRAMGISATVYHIHDPELLPAVIALRISHHRVVFDFHEEFAMQVKSKEFLRPWQRRVVSRLARCWELMLCRGAWKVVTATRGIRDRLPSRRSDAIVVYNYPSLDEFPAPSTMPFGRRPRTAYYVGGVTRIRGCYEMIRAAQILASTRSGITIDIAGPLESAQVESRIQQVAQDVGVRLLGVRSRGQVAADLATARVGLVVLHPRPNYVDSLPVKMFEYMAAGIPVVASNFPLWERIVRDADCGVTVNPLDPQEIADAVRGLVDEVDRAQQMGEAGRKAVVTKYRWASEWEKLRGLYEVKEG